MLTACLSHICRRFGRLSRLGCCCALILFLFWPLSTVGRQRAFRVFDQSSGLPVPNLSGFAQDSDGFFWIGTAAGLYRFDGREFRHWAKDKVAGWYYQIYAGPNGEVLLTCLPDNTLFRVTPNESAETVAGPDGEPFNNVRDAAFTTDGRLWVSRSDALYFRNEQQKWIEIARGAFANDSIRKLSAGPAGSLLIAASHSVWKVNPDFSSRQLLIHNFAGYIGNVISHPDGSIFYVEKYPAGGKILRWLDGKTIELLAVRDNLHDFALRGESVWASGDHHLIVLRPGRATDVLESGEDEPIGGGLVVDREGSLWITNGRELFQLPEADTEVWTERDGLPEGPSTALQVTANAVWLSTWSGVGHLQRQSGESWSAYDDHLQHKSEICIDGQGSLWFYDYRDFWQRWQDSFIRYPQGVNGSQRGCATAPDGAVWIATSRGLWRTQAGRAAPRFVTHPFADDDLGSVFEDSKQRLWLSHNEDICHAPAQPLRSGRPVNWSCQTIPGTREIGKPVELNDGTLWAGTDLLGVWSFTDAVGWRLIKNSLQLASTSIGKLVLSPAGGVWVVGKSACIRVLPRRDQLGGWQIAEQLSELQGIPAGGIVDLREEQDGDLWLATPGGIAHLRASTRFPKLSVPVIKLVGISINGKAISLSEVPQIPSYRNQIEITFAALSYRDRSLLRYQYKLHSDDPWISANSSIPTFHFFDLGPGDYQVAIRASLDGINWSDAPELIKFEVLASWYLRWWALFLFAALAGTLLLVVHRLRVRVLLQFERQRTRIAMDLHDEIGSGLGSIGILSSVAASDSLADEQRREMSLRIAETAHELGASLIDIVWSLRPEATSLESLAYHLARRAEGLFPNGAQFHTIFPDDWDGVRLTLPVRRSVLRIAMESIHNAAKHARANNVVLQFTPCEGRRWQMRIEDDGRGLAAGDSRDDGGMGIQNMIRRANEIGADIDVLSADRRGTVVLLTFDPHARERH